MIMSVAGVAIAQQYWEHDQKGETAYFYGEQAHHEGTYIEPHYRQYVHEHSLHDKPQTHFQAHDDHHDTYHDNHHYTITMIIVVTVFVIVIILIVVLLVLLLVVEGLVPGEGGEAPTSPLVDHRQKWPAPNFQFPILGISGGLFCYHDHY